MAPQTSPLRAFFFFYVWCCLEGCKRVCEESGWLEKTEDRRQKVSDEHRAGGMVLKSLFSHALASKDQKREKR